MKTMHFFIVFIFVTLITQKILSHHEKFVLITSLYNEIDEPRTEEYKFCLEKNLEHPLIETIHVIYDTSKDHLNNGSMLSYLEEKNVTITKIKGRPTYGFCFDIANKHHNQKKIILSNADIYFNETLDLLADYDLSNTFLALTRWNVSYENTLVPHEQSWSQDTWIFQTPIRKFKNSNIAIGTMHCDSRILYEARRTKFKLKNPCLSIQCCHLHTTNIRNYERNIKPNRYNRACIAKTYL